MSLGGSQCGCTVKGAHCKRYRAIYNTLRRRDAGAISTRPSAYDECLHVKSLCQLISDRRDADDVTQLVAWRPNGHARISICLVLALCQWQTVKPDVAAGQTKPSPAQERHCTHCVYCVLCLLGCRLLRLATPFCLSGALSFLEIIIICSSQQHISFPDTRAYLFLPWSFELREYHTLNLTRLLLTHPRPAVELIHSESS